MCVCIYTFYLNYLNVLLAAFSEFWMLIELSYRDACSTSSDNKEDHEATKRLSLSFTAKVSLVCLIILRCLCRLWFIYFNYRSCLPETLIQTVLYKNSSISVHMVKVSYHYLLIYCDLI